MTTGEELHPILRMIGALSYLTTILFLIERFYPSDLLVTTYSVFGAILLISAFLFISNVNRFVVSILLIVGSVCFYFEGVSLNTALSGFGKNANLLALFLLIPLIGTFMSTAGYLSALKEKVQEKERQGGQHPYRLSFFLTASIGAILNFGAMALVKRISEESFSSYKDKRITLNIMRAFGFCLLWSPYFVNVGLVLVIFNLSWFDIAGYSILLALFYLMIAWLMFKRISFFNDPIVENEKQINKQSYYNQSLLPFFLFSFVLVFMSFLLYYNLTLDMITIVSLMAVVLPIIWACATKMIRSYIHDVVELVEHSFLRLKNEFAVFISAGYFGMAISQTDIGVQISSLLFTASFGSVYLLTIFIVIIAILLAQIGIHPIIIVTGIGSALSPMKFGVSPEYMALVLLIAWTTSTQISPFSGQVLMASKLMEQPAKVLIKENLSFSAILAIVLTSVLYSFYLIGWL
ncbi:hypothetical protein ACJ2A9_01245 [Anaerobacillus sp. MEB173]|uniref:hypothetical protein n=1 Tax=Anaerobacillus sp. MEB173 TaxID=3383345 RepID=UPI003F911F44